MIAAVMSPASPASVAASAGPGPSPHPAIASANVKKGRAQRDLGARTDGPLRKGYQEAERASSTLAQSACAHESGSPSSTVALSSLEVLPPDPSANCAPAEPSTLVVRWVQCDDALEDALRFLASREPPKAEAVAVEAAKERRV